MHLQGRRTYFIALFLIGIVVLGMLMCADTGSGAAISWLFVCFLLSILMRPILPITSLQLADGGFALSLGLGTALTFLVTWYLAALNLVSFSSLTCTLVPLILGAAVMVLVLKRKLSFSWNKYETKRFLLGFAAFAVVFFLAFYARGYRSNLNSQTEQFMDFGFMSTMFRQERVPFEDFWLSGNQVNYYYLGQACAVFFCKCAHVQPEYGYSLSIITIFSAFFMMILTMTGSVIYRLAAGKKLPTILGGFAASMTACLGGNGYWLLYGIIYPALEKITGRSFLEKDMWFPDPTVYITRETGVVDHGKHEYPAYTFILGDLHAHLCNMFFTIPLLAILLDYAADSDSQNKEGEEKASFKGFLRKLFTPRILLIGVLLGLYQGTNYWDFAIYYVIAGAIILFSDYSRTGISLKTTAKVLCKGALIMGVSKLSVLPFLLNFTKIASEIKLCDRHSESDKFLLVWGIFLVLATAVSVIMIIRARNSSENRSVHLAILALALCAIGLLLVPEVVYIKDIYGDDYQRFNTMFKLTYQAFILFGILMGIAVGLALSAGKPGKITGCVSLVVALLLAGYSVEAFSDWMLEDSEREGISSTRFLTTEDSFLADAGAILYLNDLEDKNLTVLEATSGSYQNGSYLSAFSGTTSVVGWSGHEHLWRGDWDYVGGRMSQVDTFYTCNDINYCAMFLGQYDVDYILIGTKELEKYAIGYEGFLPMVRCVWLNEAGSALYAVDKSVVRSKLNP